MEEDTGERDESRDRSSFAPAALATSPQRLISAATKSPKARPVSVGSSEPRFVQAILISDEAKARAGAVPAKAPCRARLDAHPECRIGPP